MKGAKSLKLHWNAGVSARVFGQPGFIVAFMDDAPNNTESGQPPELSPQGHRSLLRPGWPLAIIVLALCGLMAFALHQCSPGTQAQKLADAGGTVVKGMEKLAAAISEHTVTQTFVDHVDALKPDLKNRMLVAERDTTEVFNAEDVSWHGTATAELRVPATYHYYIALSGAWDLRVQVTPAGVVGDVIAPDLHPLEPSFDTTRLEMKSANGWANWNGAQLQDDLLKNLTLKLDTRAATQMSLSYPTAHEAVEKFVRDWMLREYNLAPETPVYLRVHFHNEPGAVLAVPSPKG